MRVGLRILGKQAVVFGMDDFGSALFPDLGLDGYEQLHALAQLRREANGYRTDPPFKGLRSVLERIDSDPLGVLPDRHVVIEVSFPVPEAGLYLYDPSGTQVAGPFPDVEGIVAASFLHPS